MKLTDLTIMEISGLRAVFPDLLKQSAPLVQHTLKKVLQCINDAEDEMVAQSKAGDDSPSTREATLEDIHVFLHEKFMDFMADAIKTSKERGNKIYEILSQDDFLKDFDPREHKITPERPTYEVTVDNVTINWPRYEADLAKEIALKVTDEYSDPKEAADYAVSVAKAVVENLKKK